MRRVAAVLGAILLVMLAGNAALTYCVVALSKETSTGGGRRLACSRSKLAPAAASQPAARSPPAWWLSRQARQPALRRPGPSPQAAME